MENIYPIINNLIENLESPSSTPKNTNIILDGGGFNGLYQVGVLAYFNKLKENGHIKINKISGCSIGALCGLLYILSDLESGIEGFQIMRESYKNTGCLIAATKWVESYKTKMKKNDYIKLNGRLFVTYYNIKTCKQQCISTFKSNKHLLNTVIKSMSLPFVYDGSIALKNKYLDGFTPYIFKDRDANTENIFINLHSFDRISGMYDIKYNKNVYSRVLNGINNAHIFYATKQHNSLCSNINEWNYIEKLKFSLREKIYLLFVHFLSILFFIKNLSPNFFNKISKNKYLQLFRKFQIIYVNEFLV